MMSSRTRQLHECRGAVGVIASTSKVTICGFILSTIRCKRSHNAPFLARRQLPQQDLVACVVPTQDVEDVVMPAIMGLTMAEETTLPGTSRGLLVEEAVVTAITSTTSVSASPRSRVRITPPGEVPVRALRLSDALH